LPINLIDSNQDALLDSVILPTAVAEIDLVYYQVVDIVPDSACMEDRLASFDPDVADPVVAVVVVAAVALVPAAVAGLEIDAVPAKELHPIDFGWVVPVLWHYPVVVDYAAAAAEEENYLVLRQVDTVVGSPVVA
jgi:hypothetical protein